MLLVLIFLFIRETASVKEEINMSFKSTRALLTGLDKKIDMGFNNCVSKFRVINGEYLVQCRKMNELGSQPIISNTSNGYSDSESVKNTNHKIIYLSDNGNDVKNKTAEKKKTQSEGEKSSAKKNEFQIDYSKVSDAKVASVEKKPTLSDAQRHSTSGGESDEDDDVSTDISIDSNILPEKKSSSSRSTPPKENIVVNDHDSLVTSDIKVSLDELHPLDHYTKKDLDKIAKKYLIPTTCKDGSGIRRPLLKTELYDEIKNKLSSGVAV